MTAPAPPRGGLTVAQLAAIVALLQAQAAARQRLNQAAVAAALAPFKAFTAWWDAKATDAAIAQVLRVLQPLQRQAARQTDAYTARVLSTMSGKSVRPVGAVDVSQLRQKMPRQVVERLARGEITPPYLELGSIEHGPSEHIDTPFDPLIAPSQAEYLPPADVYGRVADGVRYDIVANGLDEPAARKRALVRIEAAAATDVTLAVRAQYYKALAEGRTVRADGWRRIVRPELSKTGPCGLCVVAADRIYSRADLLPIHNRCVPEGTRVAAEGVLAVTRRKYSGSLVVLLTASGQEMTITAQHPVLTDEGWIPAYLVNEGHHLIRHRAGHGVVGRSPYEGDGPPLIEDVWRAATVDGAFHRRVMPVATEDFHGDWSDGEVEVVSTDRGLARVGDVSFGQPVSELPFVAGHALGAGLPGFGALLGKTLGEGAAAYGGIRSGRNGLPLLPGGGGVEVLDGLGLAAGLDVGFLEPTADYCTLHSVLLGQGELGAAGAVLLDDLRVGEVLPNPTRFDPAGAEFSGEGRHAYAQLGRDLLERLSGSVELDRVVHQRRIEGTHWVFNLHTIEGWYSASNYIVSNCVCEVLPIMDGLDPGLFLNRDDLNAIYKAAGGTGGEKIAIVNGRPKPVSPALQKLRVALTEHGELGPVLVDAGQNFRGMRQVAKTQSTDRRFQVEAQLAALERTFERLIARKRAGEDVDKPYEWQANAIDKLRAELAVLV